MKEKTILPMLLKQLHLPTMAHLCQDLNEEAIKKGWVPNRYLTILCEYELSRRADKRLANRIKEAKLPKGKSLEVFDFKVIPALNKTQIMAFASGDFWIKNGNNLLLFGPSGVGKTHLAAAIGEKLVESGYRVFFTRTTTLVQKLQTAKRELTLPSVLNKLNKYDCLILDDFGYVQKDQSETNVLFELICERYENKSFLITCNQGFDKWDKIFMDKAMAVAAVDRLIHHASIFELNTESYRRRTALAQAERLKKEKIKKTPKRVAAAP